LKKELVEVPRTTLEFYKYEEDGLVFYEFNATACQPPEPMVNAMNGLGMLQNENDRLVGIFFHEPSPLLDKVSATFSYESQEQENGDFKIIFKKK